MNNNERWCMNATEQWMFVVVHVFQLEKERTAINPERPSLLCDVSTKTRGRIQTRNSSVSLGVFLHSSLALQLERCDVETYFRDGGSGRCFCLYGRPLGGRLSEMAEQGCWPMREGSFGSQSLMLQVLRLDPARMCAWCTLFLLFRSVCETEV